MKVLTVLAFTWGILFAQTLVPEGEATAIEAAMASGKRLSSAMVEIHRGYGQSSGLAATPAELAATDAAGIARASTRQWERIEVRLPRVVAADYMGCLMVNSQCRSLPVGSSFDKYTGVFYWHVPNVFKGDFDLVFHQPGSSPLVLRVTAAPEVTTRLK